MKPFLIEASSRANGLNLFRLVFAGLVVVSHTFPLGGLGPEPVWGNLTVGGIGVAGFFAISGFLVSRSRLSLTFGEFLRRRFFRIFPGYLVAILVTAFVLAVILSSGTGGSAWRFEDAVAYVLWSVPLVLGTSHALDATVTGLPYPVGVNGNLWTLAPEVLFYIGLALVFLVPAVRKMKFGWLFVLLGLNVFTFLGQQGVLPLGELLGADLASRLNMVLLLANYFVAGVTLNALKDKVVGGAGFFVLSAAAWALLTYLGFGFSFAALFFAYAIFWLSVNIPAGLKRVGSVNDYSYGLYIYSFPVQQILAMIGVQSFGIGVFLISSLMFVAPFAFASWHLVEKPALNFSRKD